MFLLILGNSFINSKTVRVEIIVFGECDDFANISQWAAGQAWLSFRDSVTIWNLAYGVCIDYQMEHLIEIEEDEEIIED